MMKGPEKLLASEYNWVTRMGLSFGGERVVFRGQDLFHQLKDMRWMELYMFGITGRKFTDEQIRLFEGMWSLCTSYPDPRIWNNGIASLAGTARSTCTLGVSAATAVSEATIYGRRPDIRAIDFLLRIKRRVDEGEALETVVHRELHKYRGIAGYARPLVNRDERIKPLLNLATELGLGGGAYVNLAFEIDRLLSVERYRMSMNVAALGAALAADQNLSSYEYYLFLTPSFIGGMIPCFMEAREREEGLFLPISCNSIEFIGKDTRGWDP
jgi:hypothetical protein